MDKRSGMHARMAQWHITLLFQPQEPRANSSYARRAVRLREIAASFHVLYYARSSRNILA
eukprot:1373379-Amphidinium_carterae.1